MTPSLDCPGCANQLIVRCQVCLGRGFRRDVLEASLSSFGDELVFCDTCSGTGYHPCGECSLRRDPEGPVPRRQPE